MDRFTWSDGILPSDEQLVTQQTGVKLYDGEDKTSFDNGKMLLTTHRLIWKDHKNVQSILSLPLSYVVLVEEQAAGFYKSPKIILHLSAVIQHKAPGPVSRSPNNHIKLSFRDGGESEFNRRLHEAVNGKAWETQKSSGIPNPTATAQGPRHLRAGIVGIERKIHQKQQATDQSISKSFEDLSKLMVKAKEMVALSKNISNKIREKQGDITEDETIRFKSYLLSLGVSDPVTRDTHGTGTKYYQELAKQINTMIQTPLKECGGMMTLTDVYCRVNRARGMELLSPDDLVNACKLFDQLTLPIRLRVFDSGVMVLQAQSHSEDQVLIKTTQAVESNGCVTADELSRLVGVSVILCKERLFSAEQLGHLCRDETIEGLRFYPNRFLTERNT